MKKMRGERKMEKRATDKELRVEERGEYDTIKVRLQDFCEM